MHGERGGSVHSLDVQHVMAFPDRQLGGLTGHGEQILYVGTGGLDELSAVFCASSQSRMPSW